jgi:hypothetical protein
MEDLSGFSEVECAVLRASPRWDDIDYPYDGCSLIRMQHLRDDFENGPEMYKIGDIIEVSPESTNDRIKNEINSPTEQESIEKCYFIVVDESCKLRKILNIKPGAERGVNVIKIPVDICKKVGMKPYWRINGENYPTLLQHPIEYYGDRVRYKHELSAKTREDKEGEYNKYLRWEHYLTYELELTAEQYSVAESLPEKDGWRSWPSLQRRDLVRGVRARELETEVKFKLVSRPVTKSEVDLLFPELPGYDVRRVIASYCRTGTAILKLED